MPSSPADLPADLAASHELLHTLLAVSLTGVILFRPVYAAGEGSELVDLAYGQLNPAAQRMLGLPAHPVETFRTLYPNTLDTGIFAFYRDTFLSGQPGQYAVNYAADGLDNFFLLSAQRSGELLLVSFSDTAEQQRSAVAQALRESQAREQAARAEAERQRGELERVFEQAPAAIAVYRGPAHTIELVNATAARLWGRTRAQLLGKGLFEALPEIVGLGYEEPIDGVLATGVPYVAHGMEALHDRNGQRETVYWDFVFVPAHAADGHRNGVMVVANEVTAQVLARRQLEQANGELEARVQQRTREALALQADLLAAAQHQAAERLAFYHIFEQAPVLVALLRSPSHRFEYVNPAYQALFPGRQLVGLEVAAAVPEVQAQGFGALMDRVYQTGETYVGQEMPFVAPPAPGQPPRPAYYNFTYQAYRENGQTVGVSIFAFDVTEQVLARQERETQQQQLQQLFRQAPMPIVLLDGPDLVFELVNPAYQRIFPGRTLAGKPLLEALPELVGTPIPDLFQRVYQTGEPVTVQDLPLWMARHEGHAPEEIYWTFTYQARRPAGGAIDGVWVFAHDVTEQVRARQQLEASAAEVQESEARFRTMADAAPNLVWALHPDASAQYANQAFLQFLGFTLPEFVANHWAQHLHPDDAAPVQQALTAAIASGTRFALEHRLRRADGPYRWLLSQGAPSYLPTGELYSYVGSSIDITDLKQVNEQLRRTNVDLDTFVYTASHDLKAPITNIEGILAALRDTLPAAVQQEAVVGHLLGLLDHTVGRFLTTIHQLTDLSRLQRTYDEPAELLALAPVVAGVLEDLGPVIGAAAAQVQVEVPAELHVSCTPASLRSIVYNLLSNAVKYRDPARPAQVWLQAAGRPGAVVLSVRDNGLGLTESQQGRLFGVFQRLHTHVEGTGVGLYMIKRLIENAGASIAVTSAPGVGSTFTVTFPA